MLLKFIPVPPLHNLTLSTGSACRHCWLQVREGSRVPLSSHLWAECPASRDILRLDDHPLQGGYSPAAVFLLNRNIYFHLFFCLKTPSLTVRWYLIGQEVMWVASSPLSQNHRFWPWGISWDHFVLLDFSHLESEPVSTLFIGVLQTRFLLESASCVCTPGPPTSHVLPLPDASQWNRALQVFQALNVLGKQSMMSGNNPSTYYHPSRKYRRSSLDATGRACFLLFLQAILSLTWKRGAASASYRHQYTNGHRFMHKTVGIFCQKHGLGKQLISTCYLGFILSILSRNLFFWNCSWDTPNKVIMSNQGKVPQQQWMLTALSQ